MTIIANSDAENVIRYRLGHTYEPVYVVAVPSVGAYSYVHDPQAATRWTTKEAVELIRSHKWPAAETVVVKL